MGCISSARKASPLISLETFRAIQERLKGRKKGESERTVNDEDFPLRGLIHCAKCGKRVGGGWSKGNGGGYYAYYFCQNRRCDRYKKSLPREKVEERFEALLHQLIPSGELAPLVEEIFRTGWEARAAAVEETRKQLLREREAVDRQISQFADRIIETRIPEVVSAYERRIRDLKLRQEEIEEKLRYSTERQPDFEQTFRTALDFLANLGNFGIPTAWRTVRPSSSSSSKAKSNTAQRRGFEPPKPPCRSMW